MAVALAGAASVGSAQEQTAATPAPGLFSDTSAPADVRPSADPKVMRQRYVRVNLAALGDADGPPRPGAHARTPPSLTLALFEGRDPVSLKALLDRVTSTSPGAFAWIGHLEGVDLSSVILVANRKEGILQGSVTLPGASYRIRYVSQGVHAVEHLDSSAFPDGPDQHVPIEPPSAAPDAGPAADDASQIDVLVVYTPAARAAAGGVAAMNTLVDLAVTETNGAYQASGITQRVRVVYKGEISYTESGDFLTDLNRLTGTSDGYMDTVHTLRNTYGADLVSLFNEGTQYCGIANLMTTVSSSFAPNGFSVVARECATGYYSFAHEMGHNMAARHDWFVDPTNNSPYTYNHGYVAPSKAWRTIMAYGDDCAGCTRIQRFSNPSLLYQGAATGVAEGSANAADNRKALNNSAFTVANFRQAIAPPPGVATLVSPSGTASTTLPTYTWNAVAASTWYYLWVDGPAGNVIKTWYESPTVCSGSTCSITPATALTAGSSYTWWIQTWNSGGYGPWSAPLTFTVSAGPPAIQATPASLAFGNVVASSTKDLTVTVKNVGGGTLSGSGSVTGAGYSLVGSGSYSLAANQTAVLTVRFAPTGAGSASGSLALTGGGGATVPLSGTGTTPPALSVSTTTATPGQTIQVTVSNGPGNPRDWVGMHASGAADTILLDWKYLSGTRVPPASGLASATLSFTLPTTPGTYNFRLFQNDSFTKLATSATVTVQGAGTPGLSVSTTTATPGQTIQVTVSNGPGNPRDWVGMHASGAADTVHLDWKYLSGTRTPPASGLTSATLSFTLPTTPGTYNFRFFQNDTYLKLATSATVTVQGAGTPGLSVSTTTATPGQTIQVTVSNGPGNPRDWVGMHASGAADTSWLDWKYLSGTRTPPASGLTSAILSFTLPAAPGTYNFRLFQNDSFTKLATSATVTSTGGADSDGDGLSDSVETNTGVFVDATNTGTNPFNPDTDGDGINDGDEVLGTAGGLDLPGLGANPLRKDIFMEYDWFNDTLGCGSHSHRPTQAMMDRVAAAFAGAPVTNPNGVTGIAMHNDFGQGGVFTGGNLIADADGRIAGGVVGNDSEFNTYRNANFAANRRGYFHYVIMPHDYTDQIGSSGQAELPGNDLIVSLQCLYNDTVSVANTIMHELGHNLGLRHGGFEDCNWKPNYNSVMNYRYQFPGVDTNCDARGNTGEGNVLSYSTGVRMVLNENNLFESQGVCGTPAIDWNGSGFIENGIIYDLNRDPNSGQVNNSGCTANLMTLQDSNDWPRIVFTGLSDTLDAPTWSQIINCNNPARPKPGNGSGTGASVP